MNRSKGLRSREAIVARELGRAWGRTAALFFIFARSRDREGVTLAPSMTLYHIKFCRPFTTSAMAEHRAMIQCTSSLTALLQYDLHSVSSKLLARGLITDEVFGWMLTAQGVSNSDKAQRMISCVTDRVRGSPERFQSFVGVLREESYFEEVVQKLITTYNNLGGYDKSS